ncbi:MAG: IPT/TIG domain-containing protein [Polyangiaceae bacterium]
MATQPRRLAWRTTPSISPSRASPRRWFGVGNESVVVTGTDFSAGMTATVGTNTAVSCTFVSSTQMTCTFPANAGSAVGIVGVKATYPTSLNSGNYTLNNAYTYTGVLNETNSGAEADYCNLQFPTSFSVTQGTSTPTIYGQIFEAGVTEGAGAPAGILAEIGYGTLASNPTTSSNGWRFFSAAYNTQVGNNDEFMGTFTAPAVAASTNYAYTYRFSSDGGLNWTYCDTNGAGSNSGLTFESNQLGTMTVTP